MQLAIQELSKKYDNKTVLDSTSFTFESGKIYGLLGRNGAGKTTFFNCLNKDIPYESGEILLDGKELKTSDIGYVVSTPTVPEFLTAREFLKFFIEINHFENKGDPEVFFDLVNISSEDRGRLMRDFSHGMKNKMQMLINIIANPNIFLLDEPLTSLDVVVSEEMKQILRQMKENRITILSTHIMDLALDLCDEIVLLNHGKLELLSKDNLETTEFKEKIIAALKEDN